MDSNETNNNNSNNSGTARLKISHKQMIALDFHWLPLIAKIAITAFLFYGITDLEEYFFLARLSLFYTVATVIVWTFILIPSIFGGLFAVAIEFSGIGYLLETDVLTNLATRFGTNTDTLLTISFCILGVVLFLLDIRKLIYYIKYVIFEKVPEN